MGILDSIMTPVSEAKDPLAEREKWLGLSQLFNSQTMNPRDREGYFASQQKGIDRQRDAAALKSKTAASSDKLAYQTAQALKLIGTQYPDIAQAIQGGFMSPKEGILEVMRRRNEPAKSEGAIIDQYRIAQEQGFTGSIVDFKQGIARAGASNFRVDNSSGSEVGTIPQGFELFTTPSGGRSMRPIAGGPEAIAAQDLVDKQKMAKETTARTGGIVLEDIKRLKASLKGQEFLDPITGPTGSIAAMVPSSARVDAGQLANTIKGNVGFDRLQQMRDESPTGGALGAINKQEMDLLSSVLGSLDLSQSEDQLIYNLDRLETVYMNIMAKAQAYPNASKHGLSSAGASSESDGIPTWNPTGGPNGKGAFE